MHQSYSNWIQIEYKLNTNCISISKEAIGNRESVKGKMISQQGTGNIKLKSKNICIKNRLKIVLKIVLKRVPVNRQQATGTVKY